VRDRHRAEASVVSPVFLHSFPSDSGVAVRYLFEGVRPG
jgi:hypothetical protein